MPDVSQVRTLSVQAELDASKYEAGQRKKVAADQAMIASDAQVAASSAKTTSVIRTSEQAFLRLESRIGGVSKASSELTRAKMALAEAEAKVAAKVAEDNAFMERGNQILLDARKLVDQRAGALRAAHDAERIGTAQAEAHSIALGNVGKSSRAAANDARNLVFQLNDVAGGLAMGQRPMQVLLQQGPQIAQMWGTLGASLRSFVTPQTVAIAGVVALGAAFAYLIARAGAFETASRQIGVSLRTMGGAAGLSTGAVQSIVDQQYRQPGFGRADTTAAARQVLGNRNVRGADVGDTLDLARNLALVNGTELPAALDALLPKLTSGAAGLRQLDDAYGILTADQLRYIDSLDRQGRQQDITRIGIDAMTARFKGEGVKSMSEFSRAVDDAGKALGGMIDLWVKNDPNIQNLLKSFALAAKTARELVTPGAVADPRAALVAKLTEQQGFLDQALAGRNNYQASGYRKAISEIQAEINKIDAKGATEDILRMGAAYKALGVAIEDDKKKTDLLIDRFNPMGKAAREAAADMEALALALAKATDPDKARQLEEALRNVGQQAYQASSSVLDKNNDATQAAVDAAEVGRADRRARALVEAEQRAREAYKSLSPAERAATDIETYIKKNLQVVREQQASAVRDLMEDIDAAAKHSLEIARAYGKGLKEGYLADVKTAVDEMVRTTPGLAGQEAQIIRQRLQQAAAQSVAQLGQQNGGLLPQVEAAERMAAAEARGAGAIREASIANQVYLATYEARARAELANNPVITAEYEKQRAILEALIRRQAEAQRITEAIALNRQFDPAAQFAADAAKIKDLAATGQVSPVAVRKAWEDAYIRMGTASDSWVQGATAGLLEYARQAQNVGAAVAGVFVKAFTAIEDALLGLGTNWKAIWQDIQRISIRQNITGPLAQLLGGASLSAQGVSQQGGNGGGISGGLIGSFIGALDKLFSSGSSGGISQQFLGGGGTGGVGSSGNGVGGGSFNPLSFLGGGGGGGSGISGIFSMLGIGGGGGGLGGFLGGGSSAAGSGMSGIGGLLGSGGGVGGGIGGGFAGILGAFSGIMSAVNAKTTLGKVGGGLQAAGSIISMIPTPWTQAIGMGLQIIGQILPLFAPKPEKKAQGWHDYDVTRGGYIGGVKFEEGGVKAPVAPEIGNNALKLIRTFGGQEISSPEYYIWRGFDDGRMDATVTAEGSPTYARLLKEAFANGATNIDDAQWAARKALWTDKGNVDLPISDLTTDSATLMQQLTLLILKAGVRDNFYPGLSDTSQKIIRNYPTADTQGLAQAMQWGKETYDVLIRGDTITQSETALTKLKDSFLAATLQAKELGLATEKLAEQQAIATKKIATDFNQTIGDRILGVTDPAGLQRVQLDREFDQLRKEAAYLNSDAVVALTGVLVNVNDLEKAYGLEREKIVSQQFADLLTLQKRLLYGDLSGATPADVVTGTSGTYAATLAQARAGSGVALARLAGEGADYVTAGQQAYGHDTRFASIRDNVLSDINSFIGGGGVTGSGTFGNDNGAGAAFTALTTMFQQQSAQIAALMEQNAILIARIDRLAA